MSFNKIFLVLLLLIPSLWMEKSLFAQGKENIDKTKYQRGFVFNKGIYLSFEHFKNNQPISSELISDLEKDSHDYYRKALSSSEIKYVNKTGDTINTASRNIWGYSDGINVYIIPKEYFIFGTVYGSVEKNTAKYIRPERVNVIGEICTFYKVETTRTYNQYISQSSSVMKEYMLNFNTGEIASLTKNSFEEILKRDKDLYQEYLKYKAKKKTKIYMFILKYNEKHPVYF